MLIIRFILLFYLFFYSVSCFADTNIYFKKIKIVGLHHLSILHILNDFNVYHNRVISYNRIQNIVLKLYKTGFFNHIIIVQNNQCLTFIFKEKLILSSIILSGNKNYNKNIILNYLKLYNIKKNNLFEIQTLYRLKHIIQKLYNTLYIYHVKIDIKYYIVKKKYIFLKINIIEDSVSYLNNLIITGNKNISYTNIQSIFGIYSNYFRNITFDHKKYNYIFFKKKLINLKKIYYENGYINFFIKNIKFYFLHRTQNVSIFLNIDEGKKYILSSIIFHGDIGNCLNKIKKEISNLYLYKQYHIYKILHIQKKLKNIFLNLGFLQCRVLFKSYLSHTNSNNIILHFYIYPKTRFFIHSINIKGNKLVDKIDLNKVIKNIDVGSFVNCNMLKQIKYNIQKIKYVHTVDIQLVTNNRCLNAVDIIYIIRENSSNILNINCGYSIFSGMNIHFKLDHHHWLGYKIKSTIKIIHNNFNNYIDLLYEYPGILRHIIFSNRIFYHYIQNNIDNILFYKNKYYGLEGKIKCIISEHNNVQLIFGYVMNNIININNQIILWKHIHALENNINDYILDDKHHSSIICTYFWKYNTIINTNVPNSGIKAVCNITFSLPRSYKNFYKVSFYLEQYLLIIKNVKCILHTRFTIGVARNFDRSDFPFYENFHFNEENNVRGFTNNSIGPKYCDITNDINGIDDKYIHSNFLKSKYSIGGNNFILSKIDLIIPNFYLLNTYYNNYFSTSLFLDFGNIWDTNWKNSIKNVHYKINNYNNPNSLNISTGVQIKWFSTIGPIVLSYSLPILYTDKDILEPLQFNINSNW